MIQKQMCHIVQDNSLYRTLVLLSIGRNRIMDNRIIDLSHQEHDIQALY